MTKSTASRWSYLYLTVAVTISCFVIGCGKDPAPAPPAEPSAPSAAGPAAPGQGPTAAQPTVPPTPDTTAQEVLDKMVAAYQGAKTYRDNGVFRMVGTQNGEQQEEAMPCGVTLERPNKIRMQVDLGTLLSNGTETYGFAQNFPGQFIRLPASQELSIASVYPDRGLAISMMQSPAQSFSWVPLQLVLLLAGDPLKTIASETHEISLLEPAMLGDTACHRVQVTTPNGPGVLWVGQADSVLHRFDIPADQIRRGLAEQGVTDVMLAVEFRGAELDAEIPAEAFQFEAPQGVPPVDALVPPVLKILGQPSPDFQFTDIDGNPANLQSLEGKIIVLQLWATTAVDCRPVLQAIDRAKGQWKDPDSVAVMAVAFDNANVQSPALKAVLEDWQVDLPIYRDLQRSVVAHYGDLPLPLTIIIGKQRKVQWFQPGGVDQMDAVFTEIVDRLGQGEDVYRAAFEQFNASQSQFEEMRRRAIEKDMFGLITPTGPQLPRAEVKPRTEPKALPMTKLWSCDQIKQPGNILVVDGPDGAPRILVVDQAKAVVELDTVGQVAATHVLELNGPEVVTVLDTAVDGSGQRYYLGSARGVQRIHLFDETFKTVATYPDSDHAGVGDARLTDLDGDGALEMVVGYFDVVGLQAADTSGKRIWGDRSVVNVLRVAPLPPDDAGQRNVLAFNGSPACGTLVEFAPDGKRLREIVVPEHSVAWMAADDLTASGTAEICVLAQRLTPDAPPVPGQVAATGIDANGKVLWQHPLPPGIHIQQIEPVTSGSLLPDGGKQWLIATADGSIHIIAADGRPIESFAYGAELSGLATAQVAGKPVLLVATPNAVDAWQIEAPAAPALEPPSN